MRVLQGAPLILLATALAASLPSASGFVAREALHSPTSLPRGDDSHNSKASDRISSYPRPIDEHGSFSTLQQPMTLTLPTTGASATALAMSPSALVSPLTTTPLARRLLSLLAAAATCLIVSKRYKQILWPNSAPDPDVSAPLPPGSFGCPFLGSNIMSGDKEYGMWSYFARTAKKLGNPRLFKFFTFGIPCVSVSGIDNIRAALKHEFEPDGINTMLVSDNMAVVFGEESLLYEGDKAKHARLRRLAGMAMSPSAIRAAVPTIQDAAERKMDAVLSSTGTVRMEDVANEFTLDIAHSQILGLDLKDEDVPEFRRKTKQWLDGFTNPLYLIPFRVPGISWTKSGRSRKYLESKVEEKLAYLDEHGPDSSTLSKLYFAKDEEGSSLTRSELMDNALILILAGSETSSSTLTTASLLLGLHPDVFARMKSEQEELIAKHGPNLTKEQIDEECPYLDAVIRETMRIKPLDGQEFRKTKETLVIDGVQIPKNYIVYSNIRQTHTDDPKTYKEDGSHMDVKEGFNPDRWLDESTKPSVWMPFGEGGRRCLGERLAMTEMKIFLATMARRLERFDLVGPTDHIYWQKDSLMMRPIDGTEIRAHPAAASVASVVTA